MKQFSCECGFAVKWTSIEGDTPQQITELVEEHAVKLGHEEVEPWQSTQIRNEAQKRSLQGRARERASYRKRKELSTASAEVITDQLMKASRR